MHVFLVNIYFHKIWGGGGGDFSDIPFLTNLTEICTIFQ